VGSGLLLPEPLSLPAVLATALAYAVFSHEISVQLAMRQWADSDIFDPLRGACLLLIELVMTVPSIAYLISPASYGASISSPLDLLPAFIVFVLPCCVVFALVQWQVRSHNRLLFRLGLLTVVRARKSFR
jgi:hypothetical protein